MDSEDKKKVSETLANLAETLKNGEWRHTRDLGARVTVIQTRFEKTSDLATAARQLEKALPDYRKNMYKDARSESSEMQNFISRSQATIDSIHSKVQSQKQAMPGKSHPPEYISSEEGFHQHMKKQQDMKAGINNLRNNEKTKEPRVDERAGPKRG